MHQFGLLVLYDILFDGLLLYILGALNNRSSSISVYRPYLFIQNDFQFITSYATYVISAYRQIYYQIDIEVLQNRIYATPV